MNSEKTNKLIKGLKKFYEIFSLAVGISSIGVLTFFLLTNLGKCIIPMEPIIWVRIPEVIMGCASLPYYFYKFISIVKEDI